MGNESQTPDFSGLLSGLLSNPQALSMLTSLLGQMQAKPAQPPPCPPPEPPCNGPSVCRQPPPCPPLPCEKPKDDGEEKRRALLLALKPFLSPQRQETIDRILMIEEALTLFYKTKGQGGKGACT